MSGVTVAGVLGVLASTRLAQLARDLNVAMPLDAQKAAQVSNLTLAAPSLADLLPRLTRDEAPRGMSRKQARPSGTIARRADDSSRGRTRCTEA